MICLRRWGESVVSAQSSKEPKLRVVLVPPKVGSRYELTRGGWRRERHHSGDAARGPSLSPSRQVPATLPQPIYDVNGPNRPSAWTFSELCEGDAKAQGS